MCSNLSGVAKTLILGYNNTTLVTVLCGMVGSPGGWHLVPHLPAPASLMQLTEHCHRLTDFTHCPAWIVPGVFGIGYAAAMT